jgi:hypothetical protein
MFPSVSERAGRQRIAPQRNGGGRSVFAGPAHLIRQLGSGFWGPLRRVFYNINRPTPSKFRCPQAKSPAKSAFFAGLSTYASVLLITCARNAGRRRRLLQHCPGGREPTRRSLRGLRVEASAGVVPGPLCRTGADQSRTRARRPRSRRARPDASPGTVRAANVPSTGCGSVASERLLSASARGGTSSLRATADALAQDGGAGSACVHGRCSVGWFARTVAGGVTPRATPSSGQPANPADRDRRPESRSREQTRPGEHGASPSAGGSRFPLTRHEARTAPSRPGQMGGECLGSHRRDRRERREARLGAAH